VEKVFFSSPRACAADGCDGVNGKTDKHGLDSTAAANYLRVCSIEFWFRDDESSTKRALSVAKGKSDWPPAAKTGNLGDRFVSHTAGCDFTDETE
jgi:hypothetical protein